MEKINSLIKEVTMTFVSCLQNDDWDRFTIEIFAIYPFIQMRGNYIVEDKKKSFNPNIKTPSGIFASLKIGELRKLMYELNPEKGAWYIMILEVDNIGKFKIKYDYESKPPFKYEPSKEEYIAELKEFPRKEELTPKWLLEIT